MTTTPSSTPWGLALKTFAALPNEDAPFSEDNVGLCATKSLSPSSPHCTDKLSSCQRHGHAATSLTAMAMTESITASSAVPMFSSASAPTIPTNASPITVKYHAAATVQSRPTTYAMNDDPRGDGSDAGHVRVAAGLLDALCARIDRLERAESDRMMECASLRTRLAETELRLLAVQGGSSLPSPPAPRRFTPPGGKSMTAKEEEGSLHRGSPAENGETCTKTPACPESNGNCASTHGADGKGDTVRLDERPLVSESAGSQVLRKPSCGDEASDSNDDNDGATLPNAIGGATRARSVRSALSNKHKFSYSEGMSVESVSRTLTQELIQQMVAQRKLRKAVSELRRGLQHEAHARRSLEKHLLSRLQAVECGPPVSAGEGAVDLESSSPTTRFRAQHQRQQRERYTSQAAAAATGTTTTTTTTEATLTQSDSGGTPTVRPHSSIIAHSSVDDAMDAGEMAREDGVLYRVDEDGEQDVLSEVSLVSLVCANGPLRRSSSSAAGVREPRRSSNGKVPRTSPDQRSLHRGDGTMKLPPLFGSGETASLAHSILKTPASVFALSSSIGSSPLVQEPEAVSQSRQPQLPSSSEEKSMSSRGSFRLMRASASNSTKSSSERNDTVGTHLTSKRSPTLSDIQLVVPCSDPPLFSLVEHPFPIQPSGRSNCPRRSSLTTAPPDAVISKVGGGADAVAPPHKGSKRGSGTVQTASGLPVSSAPQESSARPPSIPGESQCSDWCHLRVGSHQSGKVGNSGAGGPDAFAEITEAVETGVHQSQGDQQQRLHLSRSRGWTPRGEWLCTPLTATLEVEGQDADRPSRDCRGSDRSLRTAVVNKVRPNASADGVGRISSSVSGVQSTSSVRRQRASSGQRVSFTSHSHMEPPKGLNPLEARN